MTNLVIFEIGVEDINVFGTGRARYRWKAKKICKLLSGAFFEKLLLSGAILIFITF